MRLASLLPAPRCAFCLQPADSARLCPACRADLPLPGPGCVRCAEPLPPLAGHGILCARCQRQPPPFDACLAALPYRWPVDRALKRLKFSGELCYAPAFGALLSRLALESFPDIDALCPVPLHRLRQFRRGFNQAVELSRPLKNASGLPFVKGLRRVRHTAPQSGLDLLERRRNLARAFALRRRLRCRHPLIVDDVMTTGETCRQLAALLRRHGAAKVSVLVVARAAPPSQAGASENV